MELHELSLLCQVGEERHELGEDAHEGVPKEPLANNKVLFRGERVLAVCARNLFEFLEIVLA